MKVKLLLPIFLVYFLAKSSMGQNVNTDSLIALLQNHKEDTTKAMMYESIARSLIFSNKPSEALEYSKAGIELSNQLKFIRGICYNNYGAAKASLYLSDYKNAHVYCMNVLKYEKESDKTIQASALTALGTIFIKQSDYPKALDFLLRGLSIKETLHDTAGIITSKSNIGNLYAKMNEPIKALQAYRTCEDLAIKTRRKKDIANSYINIGNIYIKLNKIDSSNYYLLLAMNLHKERKDEFSVALALGNLSLNYIEEKRYKEAEVFLLEALSINQKIGNQEFVANTYNALADLYSKQNQFQKAIEYAQKGLELSMKLNLLSNELDVHKILYSIYKLQGKHKEALIEHEKLVEINKQIFSDEKQKEMTTKELQFEFEKKENFLKAEQEKEKLLAREEKEKQQIIIYSISGGFILLLLLALLIYRNLQQNKKQSKIISVQKDMIEEKQKELLDSIHYAERIQKTLLANTELINHFVPENFILFKPKDIVSGDFYWATHKSINIKGIEKDAFYLIVADSTGHGVPGAFMSLMNISFLNEAINEKNIHEPNEILNHVRSRLISSMEGRQDGMDAAIIRVIKNGAETEIVYAAAHNGPVLIKNNELIHLPCDKMPVGKGMSESPFTKHHINVSKGDILYLYTDGYPDQFGGEKGKKFKYKQLEHLLLKNHSLPLTEQVKLLEEQFVGWKGDLEQIDDVCIVGIKVG